MKDFSHKSSLEVDQVMGAFFFIRADLFNRCNGFDERFFMFGEDIDICLRVWKENYQIHYYPKTKIIHYKGKSVKTAPYDSKRAFYHAMDLYVDKHYSSTFIIFFFTVQCLNVIYVQNLNIYIYEHERRSRLF